MIFIFSFSIFKGAQIIIYNIQIYKNFILKDNKLMFTKHIKFVLPRNIKEINETKLGYNKFFFF